MQLLTCSSTSSRGCPGYRLPTASVHSAPARRGPHPRTIRKYDEHGNVLLLGTDGTGRAAVNGLLIYPYVYDANGYMLSRELAAHGGARPNGCRVIRYAGKGAPSDSSHRA